MLRARTSGPLPTSGAAALHRRRGALADGHEQYGGIHNGVGRIFAMSLEWLCRRRPIPRPVGRSAHRHVTAEAEKRERHLCQGPGILQDSEAKAKEAADKARKAGTYARWTFVSLLLGAFTASLMATFGGRQRDHWEPA